MPIWLLVILTIVFVIGMLLFLYLFWQEWKYPKPNNYDKGTIRHFFKSGAMTLYLIASCVFGLSVIGLFSIAL